MHGACAESCPKRLSSMDLDSVKRVPKNCMQDTTHAGALLERTDELDFRAAVELRRQDTGWAKAKAK